MKYNVNVVYNVEVEDESRLREVVDALTQPRSFADATATVTGYNVNKSYVPLPIEPASED